MTGFAKTAGLNCHNSRNPGGSATEQNGVQDFKISRFHWDLRISMGFQFMDFEISMGFLGISGFLWDFNLWISRFLWDLWDYFRILRK